MSLSSDNMLKLMAYADGELEGAERIEAEMLLVSDANAATFIAQVASLGEIVELGHQDRFGKTIASFDVTAAVMGAIAKDTPAAAETARATKVTGGGSVSSLAAAREVRAKKSSGLKVGVAVAAALALAASVFVFTQHRNDEAPMALAPAPAAQAPGSSGVAIESAGKSVTVFYLPTESELSTSVLVWVDETGEK